MTSVKIGCFTYEVFRCDQEDFENNKWGEIRHDRQHIRILKKVHDDVALATLFHEGFHGIEFSRGLDVDEDAVIKLSLGLVAFLQDNGVDLTPLRNVLRDAEDLHNG